MYVTEIKTGFCSANAQTLRLTMSSPFSHSATSEPLAAIRMKRTTIILLIISFLISNHIGYSQEKELEQNSYDLLNSSIQDSVLFELIKLNKANGKMPRGPNDSLGVNHVYKLDLESDTLLAVFKKSKYDKSGFDTLNPKGHIILFDMEGNYIPVFHNANSLDGLFSDINNDGVYEMIDEHAIGSRSCQTAHEKTMRGFFCRNLQLFCKVGYHFKHLYIVPMDREQKSIFNIIFHYDLYTTVEILDRNNLKIKFDFHKKENDSIIRSCIYTWNNSKGIFEGDNGGYRDIFIRIDNGSYGEKERKEINKFARIVNRRSKRKKQLPTHAQKT